MAYVITDTCTKDEHCIEACPVACIHPTKDEADFDTVPQLYVHPTECVDCGACITVCPTNSSMALEEVPAHSNPSSRKTLLTSTKLRPHLPRNARRSRPRRAPFFFDLLRARFRPWQPAL